jgi:outer membrane immunogenic protein
MKRILIAGTFALSVGGPALAADLPPPPAPPPRAPATYVPAAVQYYNWTGIYIGINGGYNFGTVSPTGAGSFNTNGFLGGGTFGGNYQMGGLVIGIEGDADYNSVNNNGFKSDWLATVRGRAGWAFDRILFYGTGGGAFAPASVAAGNATMMGWTVGAGIEWAFAQNWSAKVEYLYVDFPSPSVGGVSFTDAENVIRVGLNYKF